jgi:hypothetical protein
MAEVNGSAGHVEPTSALLFVLTAILIGISTKFFLSRIRLPYTAILLVRSQTIAAAVICCAVCDQQQLPPFSSSYIIVARTTFTRIALCFYAERLPLNLKLS